MARITIAGLGPGRRGLRTLETATAIDAAERIVLRTAIHPDVEDLLADGRVVACDDIYQSGSSFDEVYNRIAERVASMADAGDVLYLAPGHPRYGEQVTPRIESLAVARGHEVHGISAVSALDELSIALSIDLMSSEPQSIDATSLALSIDRSPFNSGSIELSPVRPLLVTQVYSSEMASATKIALARVYGDEHDITVIRAAGTSDQAIDRIPLHRLDRVEVDHLTSVWVEPTATISASRTLAGLTRIVAALRAPGGCPWDQKQDAKSLRHSLLEEAYETVEAIESDDSDHVAEELGDLLLLIVMEAQIAEEDGLFLIEDVLEGITSKLIRRHPHIFGDAAAASSDDVVSIWQQVKATEGKKAKPPHPIDRYPAPMPIARRLADYFGDHPTADSFDPDNVGDQLFAMTKVAIEAGHDPEKLLLNASRRAIPETNDA